MPRLNWNSLIAGVALGRMLFASAPVTADIGDPSNAVRTCERVDAGEFRIEVRATAVDCCGSADLSGWLDDYTLTIDRFG